MRFASMCLTATLFETPLRDTFSVASCTALMFRSLSTTSSTPSTSRASLTPRIPVPHMGSQAEMPLPSLP